MAKCTKNQPAPVSPPSEYVLTLSQKEAQEVYNWATSTSGASSPEKYNVFEALYEAGLRQRM